MPSMKDILGDQPYPHSPGFKEPTTSKDAAAQIKGRAPSLRWMVLGAIRAAEADGLTADEAAAQLGKSVLAIRPRVTELATTKHIIPTDRTRANDSGVQARVYIVNPRS